MSNAIKFFVIVLFTVSTAYAAPKYANGVVSGVKIFTANHNRYNPVDRGTAYIYVDTLPGACGDDNQRRVAIGSDHPLFETFVSLALVSKTTNTEVSVGYLEQCSLRSNAWDFSVLELL